MNPIILATDGSPSAADATWEAVELARAAGAKLYVVSVWRSGWTTYSASPTGALPESKRVAKQQAYEAARSAVEVARAAGIEAESFVLEGDPAARICETAADTEASLLVVGSHGWGAVHRLVSGSVSTALLRRAPCPVLVVRAAEEGAIEAAAVGS